MTGTDVVFGEEWLAAARALEGTKSWAAEAVAMFAPAGELYLSTLRRWFGVFPLKPRYKNSLRAALESFRNEDHVGAVNELSWWAFMEHEGLTVAPLPASTTSRPDFQITAPMQAYVEVSTVNTSVAERAAFAAGHGVELNHRETLRRHLGKLTDEKQRQLAFGAAAGIPSVLVLFDYTIWSGLATDFNGFLREHLLTRSGFDELPRQLSTLVYVERKVLGGRIALSRLRSATYHNPAALYPLAPRTFPSLPEFPATVADALPPADPWVWLCPSPTAASTMPFSPPA